MTGAAHLLQSRKGRASAPRRVALVGAGYIAEWHAKCMASVAGVELAAVCDPLRSRAEALAAQFGVPRAYGRLEEMLDAERLDAVHVLAPPDRHFAVARTAMEAGLDVLLEKPMCDRAEDCDALVQLAQERGVRLGVGHNFLFAEPYERLRRDVRAGLLGRIDHVTITWNRFLPQSVFGPFTIWMLREPRNIMLEIGSHLAAHMLDLVGEPEALEVRAGNAMVLPTGRSFYRRWQVQAAVGHAAVEMRASFVPGFGEYSVHVRGQLGAATADIERNTYVLHQHRPADPDFENRAMVAHHARELQRQGRETLRRYILSKLKVEKRGTPYGASIARAMDGFYAPDQMDERVSGALGARVIGICEAIGSLAGLREDAPRAVAAAPHPLPPAKTLVLGGTGFIGRELVRQLAAEGRGVRLLGRSVAGLPEELRAQVECVSGDLLSRDDLARAMEGVECVAHLARSNVKTWADYQHYEIDATRQVAECALAAGVKRFVYTGTIDSYYAGRHAGTITEATPLDPRIGQRNLYARAKAASEEMLRGMQQAQGLPLVIVRPGIVIGRGGSPFHWGVGMWWHDAVCQVWGEGVNKLPLVLVEDVARGIIAAMDAPGIEGRSFNLVADPCLSAQEYLDELDRAGAMRVQRHATPIASFYAKDMLKWVVKMAVRHAERRMPSYRDWESRTQRAVFDCTAAKTELGWQPTSARAEMVRRGIAEPLAEFLG